MDKLSEESADPATDEDEQRQTYKLKYSWLKDRLCPAGRIHMDDAIDHVGHALHGHEWTSTAALEHAPYVRKNGEIKRISFTGKEIRYLDENYYSMEDLRKCMDFFDSTRNQLHHGIVSNRVKLFIGGTNNRIRDHNLIYRSGNLIYKIGAFTNSKTGKYEALAFDAKSLEDYVSYGFKTKRRISNTLYYLIKKEIVEFYDNRNYIPKLSHISQDAKEALAPYGIIFSTRRFEDNWRKDGKPTKVGRHKWEIYDTVEADRQALRQRLSKMVLRNLAKNEIKD